MKKIVSVFVVALLALTGAFAQEEEGRTQGWDVGAALNVYGQWGHNSYYGSTDGDYPRLYVGYNFNDNVWITTQIRFGGMIRPQLDRFFKEAYISVDLLGLAGVNAADLVVSAGRNNGGINNFGVGTGLNGSNQWAIANDNGTTQDFFNLDLLFKLNGSVPLYIHWVSDLDMNARNDNSGWGGSDDTWSGALDIGLDGLSIADTVKLSVNGWGVYQILNPGTGGVNTYDAANAYLKSFGGSVKAGILGLPVNLTVGGSVEYLDAAMGGFDGAGNWWEADSIYGQGRYNGLSVAAGLTFGLPNMFDIGANFSTFTGNGLKAAGMWGYGKRPETVIGVDLASTGLSFMRPYVNVGIGIDDSWDGMFNLNAGTRDTLAWELGLDFPVDVPVGKLNIITGWQRGWNHKNAKNNADNADVGHWAQYGMGSFFLTVKAEV
jgi:hypothetical protein